MATLNDLANQLAKIRKQIPFAMAQALTSVARDIEKAQKVALERRLENPTAFTVKSVRSQGARKDNLTAKVFVMPTAASYLEPFEVGGVHKLNGAALLNPKNVKLNKHGNLPRNKLSQLKGKQDTFIGELDGVNGVWQRKKAKKVKKGKKRLKRSSNGTRRERPKQRPPKLLIRFGDALPVDPVLGYQERAQQMAQSLMPAAINQALDEAIRTAK
ncbi:hypothetical protein KKJ01_10380 [Xenorhabdus bovienii]|uniref:Uncharacterized protein n=1 Tax=Xenorhabdus bovienii TaxID=40576 RepID=A0AAJ1JB60_XENBV|nr:hypothetical protein [Xenorhabdus bovienii]MDE1478623.1 hypothetical protein [Xenorhabdus bovienii]MDE1492479.1 hypothetical protein [Xenorhabdus bovienii]MDE9512208.1 hypothetical protein [Xenorhabdus bovienii]MDE9523869.1 hypothetical protein [Xenorhabdus bovienii]